MPDLLAARSQMAMSLGFHIIFAMVGIGMPLLMVMAERRWQRTGDRVYLELAHRWGKGTAILFAVGAVSGTVLSFELGLLWPTFMEHAGPIIGMPFSLEGFAFFTEAVFLGVYLYGWERISRRAHRVPLARRSRRRHRPHRGDDDRGCPDPGGAHDPRGLRLHRPGGGRHPRRGTPASAAQRLPPPRPRGGAPGRGAGGGAAAPRGRPERALRGALPAGQAGRAGGALPDAAGRAAAHRRMARRGGRGDALGDRDPLRPLPARLRGPAR